MLKKWFQSLVLALFLMTGTAFSADKIDINKATVEQLQTIKGIGKTTAKAIVAYRENTGKFSSVDDLLNVKGIGEKKLNHIMQYITVGTSKK